MDYKTYFACTYGHWPSQQPMFYKHKSYNITDIISRCSFVVLPAQSFKASNLLNTIGNSFKKSDINKHTEHSKDEADFKRNHREDKTNWSAIHIIQFTVHYK